MRVSITKIESLEIEARDLSVPFCKARQPQKGKGNTAEVSTLPEMCLLGRQGIPAGLSQKFCEALSTAGNTYVHFLLDRFTQSDPVFHLFGFLRKNNFALGWPFRPGAAGCRP